MGIDYLNHSYLLYTLMERVRRCPLNWVALIMTSSSFLVGGRLENSCMSLLFWFRSFSFHPQCRFWRKYGITRRQITSWRSTFSFLGQYCRIFLKLLPLIKDLVKYFAIMIIVNNIINEVIEIGIDLHLFFSKITKMSFILWFRASYLIVWNLSCQNGWYWKVARHYCT